MPERSNKKEKKEFLRREDIRTMEKDLLRLKEKQAKEKKINLRLIKDYLNFFKYGCPPHGGFAISPTRLLMLLLDIKNIREVTFLPRDTGRLNP